MMKPREAACAQVAFALLLTLFAGDNVSAFEPECATVRILEGQQGGASCECDSPVFGTLSGETVGEQVFEICGSTQQCAPVYTPNAITIVGPMDIFWKDFEYDPEWLYTPGPHNVKVTFKTPNCWESSTMCADDFKSVSTTIRVTVEQPHSCGPCTPDDATWICNEEFDLLQRTQGFWPASWWTGNPLNFVYLNDHLYDLRLLGVPQGDGHFISERLKNVNRTRILTMSSEEVYTSGFRARIRNANNQIEHVAVEFLEDAPWYELGDTLNGGNCGTFDCAGPSDIFWMGDTYGLFPENQCTWVEDHMNQNQLLASTYHQVNEVYWSNHTMWADREIIGGVGTPDSGREIGGPWSSYARIDFEFEVKRSSLSDPVSCSNFSVVYTHKLGKIE